MHTCPTAEDIAFARQEQSSGPVSATQASTIGEDSSLIVTAQSSGSSSPLRRAFSRKKSAQLIPSEQCATHTTLLLMVNDWGPRTKEIGWLLQVLQ